MLPTEAPATAPSLGAMRAAIARAEKRARRDPATRDDVARLRSEYAAARLEHHVRQLVEAAPPLTDAQRERLAEILRP